ncbi:MAG: sigma-70 family RNA polymerase sigma factor [Eubacteriales bacterium]|nr:sigma-70 family RNA polymerase sigma factor [Eubacteriales bacterium]
MLAFCAILDDEQQNREFEVMYYRYRKLLYRAAYAVLQDHFEAEDAVSQTFWKAAEHFDQISQPVCPKTKRFLVLICERTAIDRYRKRGRTGSVSLDAMEFDLPDALVSVLPEEEGSLGAAIARLPRTYREVILLRYADGYSVREIAGLLSMSEAAVYKAIERGKKKLEQFLNEEGKA